MWGSHKLPETRKVKCLDGPGAVVSWDAKSVKFTILQTHLGPLDSLVFASWSWQKILQEADENILKFVLYQIFQWIAVISEKCLLPDKTLEEVLLMHKCYCFLKRLDSRAEIFSHFNPGNDTWAISCHKNTMQLYLNKQQHRINITFNLVCTASLDNLHSL